MYYIKCNYTTTLVWTDPIKTDKSNGAFKKTVNFF